jgi:hypothetical protein
MNEITSFGAQSWLITPSAYAVHEAAPANISNQKWLLMLSGVAIVDKMRGLASGGWNHEQLHILPDMNGPLDYAISRFSIPRPHGQEGGDYITGFQADQWALFAGLCSFWDANQAVNAGFVVDAWRHSPPYSGTDAFSGQPVGGIFTGMVVDAGVSDSDAWLYRVGYNIALEGRIIFTTVPAVP